VIDMIEDGFATGRTVLTPAVLSSSGRLLT
jgi:hypothetical protein